MSLTDSPDHSFDKREESAAPDTDEGGPRGDGGRAASPASPSGRTAHPVAGAAPPIFASSLRVARYAFALAALEWLFFVTKPSFLGAAPFPSQFATLWVTSVPWVAGALLLHLAVVALGLGLCRLGVPRGRWLLRVGHALTPALLLTATSLLLIDNFVYTVFAKGLISVWGVTLVLPGLALLALFCFFAWRSLRRPPRPTRRFAGIALGGWLGCVALAFGWLYVVEGERVPAIDVGAVGIDRAKLPNIIIVGADGVESERLSAYGYRRKTTPNLDRYLDRAWVFENAFTNSGKTTSALTAMMTGRHPTTTKVIYPPHTLRGNDAYMHLPRILRGLGYRGIQETVRYYADGEDLNWKESFEEANDRTLVWPASSPFGTAVDHPSRLSREIRDRLQSRLKHLVGVERMVNVFEEMTSAAQIEIRNLTNDRPRMERLLRFIDEGPGPFFAHIHLLEAHCCSFRPVKRVFSKKMAKDDRRNRQAAYDDTILATDRSFGQLMDHLEAKGLLQNTIVVYMSDHSRGWGVKERIPLIFFLPDGKKVGRETKPAQLIDVAPTLLEAMGLKVPDWMEGTSLFEELPQDRPIVITAQARTERFKTTKGQRRVKLQDAGPPSYGLSELGLAHCQRWYIFDLEEGTLASGEFAGYVSPCPADRLPSDEAVADLLQQHLRERGFAFTPWVGAGVAEN